MTVMNLDSQTVAYLIGVGACIMSIGLFALARSYPSYMKGIARWTYATLVLALGWLLIGALGSIPGSVFSLVGDTFVVLATALYYHALKEFKEESFPRVIPYTIFGIVFLSLIYFSVVIDKAVARSCALSAGAAILMFMNGHALILRGGSPLPFGDWFTGIGFLACSLTLAVRTLSALFSLFDPAQTLLVQESFQSWYLLSFYFAVLATSLGFMLICQNRHFTEIEDLVMLDSLTKAYTRRALFYLMDKEISRSQRAGLPMSVLMFDVDRFKFINDSFGHVAGDAVLQHIAKTAADRLREQDFIGRYGGDEFLVVLPDTTGAQALEIAERLCSVIEETKAVIGHRSVAVTISIGVAELDPDAPDEQALVHRADLALYESKKRWSNRAQLAASQ